MAADSHCDPMERTETPKRRPAQFAGAIKFGVIDANVRSESDNRMTGKFDDFVEENFATAYRFAFCLSLAHDRATRLVDTTFQDAEFLRSKEPGARVDKNWVLETLHRKWRACHPLRRETDETEDGGTGNEALISVENADDLQCDVVLKILHSMTPAHRLVLSLFYFEQLGYREIARILELPAETVISRLAQAKVLLRQTLERGRRDASLHSESPEISAGRSG